MPYFSPQDVVLKRVALKISSTLYYSKIKNSAYLIVQNESQDYSNKKSFSMIFPSMFKIIYSLKKYFFYEILFDNVV